MKGHVPESSDSDTEVGVAGLLPDNIPSSSTPLYTKNLQGIYQQ